MRITYLLLFIAPPLSIHFHPQPINDILERRVNEDLTVSCYVKNDGVPPANLTWIKDGMLLNSTRSGRKEQLTFSPLTASDYGNYTCMVGSSHSPTWRSIMIIPLCKLLPV